MSYVPGLNPDVTFDLHHDHITARNALGVVSGYDVVLDCTDRPATRYLLSDAAVTSKTPLVTAAALRTEGQLMVLNNPAREPGQPGGPCYRCIFPKPPPADTVTACSDGGILGPVVGVMGVLQALEALKLLVGDDNATVDASPPSMLLFSANSTPQFRSVRLRSRRPDCLGCSGQNALDLPRDFDYNQFCGLRTSLELLRPDERISPTEFSRRRKGEHILLDVREKVEFGIYHLDGSVNAPWSELQSSTDYGRWLPSSLPVDLPIYVVCRQGNDSQHAVRKLKDSGFHDGGARYVGDIMGGLREWRNDVDHEMPNYWDEGPPIP